MARENIKFPEVIMGKSPLGGSSVDENIDGDSVPEVPLVYDARVDAYVSEQAVEELDDREITEERQKISEDEEAFRLNAGYRR